MKCGNFYADLRLRVWILGPLETIWGFAERFDQDRRGFEGEFGPGGVSRMDLEL